MGMLIIIGFILYTVLVEWLDDILIKAIDSRKVSFAISLVFLLIGFISTIYLIGLVV